MDFFDVLRILGGVGLFLFGMNTLGAGLERLSGGKLEMLLQKLSGKLMSGVALGAIVTMLLQSSSATTVIVVGFVNSGIMKLGQAVGIIMGANIGTTFTAWLTSTAGINSDNVFMTMLKPINLAAVAAIAGIVLFSYFSSNKKRDIGQVLIGFAVLMFGMDTMTSVTKELAENEVALKAFSNIFQEFSKNPILGVLAGAVITGIIQASAASVAILQGLTVTGAITFSAAFPIIMGQNIGTCVTALISSIGVNKNAKRAAMIHLYFNIIGTVVFLVIMYLGNFIFDFSFWEREVNGVGIAVIHMIFNFAATLLLLPFSKQLEKLAVATVRDKIGESDTRKGALVSLDDRLLQSPSLALARCTSALVTTGECALGNFKSAASLFDTYSEDVFRRIEEDEDKIDITEDMISSYLVKLTDKDLSVEDSKKVSKLLHSVSDFERIGDHAMSAAKIAKAMAKKGIVFSGSAKRELDTFIQAIEEIIQMATDAFKDDNLPVAMRVEPLEEVIDRLSDYLKNKHIERLRTGRCSIDAGVSYMDLVNCFERIADHCSNLAVYVIELKGGKMDTHEYLKTVKTELTPEFKDMTEFYASKYYPAVDAED